MKEMTLCFLLNNDKILLALKKRGFGEGKLNGVGGKINSNETIENAMIRETEEELCVKVIEYNKVADLRFYFPDYKSNPEGILHVHAFNCNQWNGSPQETEEMKPYWYKTDDIPYSKMWSDDEFWLPKVLAKEKISADFYFDKNEQIINHTINLVDTFN